MHTRYERDNSILASNHTINKRASLVVSLLEDEGRTWKWPRHLERESSGSYHYPAVIQTKDDRAHVVYSYFVKGGKSMKPAAFTEAWITQGDK